MKISLLILTIPSRYAQFGRLQSELRSQILPFAGEIEMVVVGGSDKSIGQKRNEALQRAKGDYLCFIDDDDALHPEYIYMLIKAADSGCDCASLKGLYCINGVADGLFEHSIKYSEWRTTTNDIKYERYPNHLNLIKSSIAKQFKFPEINHGEDKDWSTQIHESGLLKTEYYIPQTIYYYQFISNKPAHA